MGQSRTKIIKSRFKKTAKYGRENSNAYFRVLLKVRNEPIINPTKDNWVYVDGI